MRVTSSRFIGRRPELAELQAGLSEATDGNPSIALVGGESGVGKSRLLDELIARAREAGARVIGGESVELGQDELPYGPIVSALRPLVRDGDPALEDLPDPLRAELTRLVPELGAPLPAAGEREDQSRRQLFEALLALLDRLGEEAPVLLWIDDAHWADSSTRAFLAFLATGLCNERVLTVVAYRSDELHRRHPLRPLLATLERAPRTRRIELARFDREELGNQLEDILGEPPSREVIERFYGRSEGNALFTEELLAAGLDGRGALPPTLRDALLLRIERLSEDSQRALQVLAVIGRADHELLATVCGIKANELADGLREAVTANVVEVTADDRYEFRHALLREVIYDDLLPGQRSELHEAVAEALESRVDTGDGGVWIATGVAHHFHVAGNQPQALRAAVRAAKAASRVDAHGEAAALLERALELWDRTDNPEELAGADHTELVFWAGRLHERAGEEERAIALFERALERLDRDKQPQAVADVLGELANAQWSLGLAESSREALHEALALLPPDDPTPERARLLMHQVRFLLLQGRFEEVREASEAALATVDATGPRSVRAAILHRLGAALFALGDQTAGTEAFREAIEIAREVGSSENLAAAFLNWADALHQSGRSVEAREIAMQGQQEVPSGYFPERWLGLLRSEIAFALGDWTEAEDEVPARGSVHGGVSLVNADLRHAELALGRGDRDSARPLVAEARELMARAVEPQFLAVAGALNAEIERGDGDLDAARAAADWAIDRIQYCSEDGARMARVAAAAVTVEADAAERARDRADDDAERDAIARAELHAARVEAAAEEDGRLVTQAYAATARAELARAQGRDYEGPAAAAAEAWERIAWPYPRAVAMWRQAEAEVASGDRDAASRTAATALALARRLGSAWLAEELSGLAARARLRLQDAADAEEAEGEAAAPENPFGLTPRELQVLALVAAGATNREIAAELFMAEKTASVHVSRILGKLDVRSRTEAAAVAHRNGLAEAPQAEVAEERG
jgi:predicted ATPase/DNA-binding CsgD family transcriptional regulator